MVFKPIALDDKFEFSMYLDMKQRTIIKIKLYHPPVLMRRHYSSKHVEIHTKGATTDI